MQTPSFRPARTPAVPSVRPRGLRTIRHPSAHRGPSPRRPRGRDARARERIRWLGLLLALFPWGCEGDGLTGPDEPLDLDALFAPPTQAEREAVLAEWASRDVSATEWEEVDTDPALLGTVPATVRIVRHRVGSAAHHGAVVTAVGADPGSLPVVVYAHGGDRGVDVAELLLLAGALGSDAAAYGWVVPAFRGEPLRWAGSTWESDADPSPWDRDVDDALALLTGALEHVPELDGGRVGVVGLSRGAAVGMLMGVRDPRIDRVVEFFGPTDFFGPFVREVVEEALEGHPRDLPGLAWLDSTVLAPLARGDRSVAEVRLELLRRSAVAFADLLPPLQLHHGTADAVVDVSQAQAMIDTMAALGREPPEFEGWLYPGGGHNPLTLSGALGRTESFLEGLREADPAAAAPAARRHTRAGAPGRGGIQRRTGAREGPGARPDATTPTRTPTRAPGPRRPSGVPPQRAIR